LNKKDNFLSAVRENENAILKIASVYTDTADDKNDLVQEILFQLWKSFDSFKERSAISTWIYRVALNVALHQLRTAKKRVPTVLLEEDRLNYATQDNSGAEQKWQVFRQLVENLHVLDKAIILLYLEKKSYQEMAAILGLTETNVATRLSRIKDKLKLQIIKQADYGS